MNVDHVYVTIMTKSHHELVSWWTTALGRRFVRMPVPNCREWDLTSSVIFQVIDGSSVPGKTEVALHVDDVDRERERLIAAGIDVTAPTLVDGFQALRLAQVRDPDGNRLSLLSGK